MIAIQQRGDAVTFSVRVHPKARRERISGTAGDSLKLELTAPPVEGKANEACIRFFADLLKVPRSSVTIAAGASSRNKVIRIAGVSAATVEQAIAAALKTSSQLHG
jgi:uncharacterized protein (TIGR00251 family)